MNAPQVKPQAQIFSLTSPLLKQGRQDNPMAETDMMKVVVKVYAAGGENGMHMHPYEDHTFVVLQGEATFRLESDDNLRVLRRNEGIMLPRGVSYWFQSSAAENLVMLRVGAATKWPADSRAFPDGRPFDPMSVENKEVERIPFEGKFFSL